MIFFDALGGAFVLGGFFAAAISGGILGAVTGDDDLGFAIAFAVVLPLVIAADVAYRWRNHEPGGWTRSVSPVKGGHSFFVPVWATGAFATFMALGNAPG